MTYYNAGQYDIAVIGAGHAGIEAALAAARMGLRTVCFTINLDAAGNMPCNPAIGGTGKGHLVRELDALGGEMGRAADAACIQYRILNRGKGPAVWSLRAQADRREYQKIMKHTLETQENLWVKQGEVTRLLTEELSRDAASARGMLRRLLALGAGLGVLAMAAQAGLAGLAAKWWLGDVRAAGALRLSALGLPWMAVSAVLRGFFLARRRVGPNVASQLAEQTVRIGAVAAALYATPGRDAGERCTLVLGATALSEAVSCTLMALFCRGEARRCFGGKRAQTPPEASRRLWDILWPVEGGRVLASALHTAENMLVPACLAVYLTGAGGRAAALERYGVLKGMALPLLTFPFGLLGSLAVLLMPEITQAHVLGQTARLTALLDRMLRLTGFFSALAAALFWCWGPDAAGLLYGSAEAGFYLQVLAPVLPLLYLESMVDGAMKGVGEQKAAFRYSVWDAVLRLAGVAVLLPRYGMRGFLAVMLLSTLYTCTANTGRLLFSSGMPHAFRRWLGAPALAGALAAAAGTGLRQALALPLAGDLWPRLAALGAGGCATAGVFLLAAWPLGLGEELARMRGTI